jgi:hypothetical protein
MCRKAVSLRSPNRWLAMNRPVRRASMIAATTMWHSMKLSGWCIEEGQLGHRCPMEMAKESNANIVCNALRSWRAYTLINLRFAKLSIFVQRK